MGTRSGGIYTFFKHFNLLYTGGLFHCYMLEESVCQFRGVGSILSLLFNFDGKYNVDP